MHCVSLQVGMYCDGAWASRLQVNEVKVEDWRRPLLIDAIGAPLSSDKCLDHRECHRYGLESLGRSHFGCRPSLAAMAYKIDGAETWTGFRACGMLLRTYHGHQRQSLLK